MDTSQSTPVSAPMVHLLRERFGGESKTDVDAGKICMAAVFEKYSSMEDAAYTHFEKDRSIILLHFHLESHDSCAVKLKPLLWDRGAYNKPNLLRDGALRLIPHFLPMISRQGETLKRALSPPQATMAGPVALRRRLESPGPAIRSEEEEEEDAVVFEQAGRKTKAKTYDHSSFAPRSTHRLPKNVSRDSWTTDFEAAKRNYLNGNIGDQTAVGPKEDLMTARHAHKDMINGVYGMDTLDPCDHCVKAGVTCRVYHSECYEWPYALRDLGWRCARCRTLSGTDMPGGCNAQHKP